MTTTSVCSPQMDNDSTYGEEASNASTSIYSSITCYEWKHNRRYHAYQSGSYCFPNDDREQDRLDMLHHAVTRILDDKLFLAPIDPAGMRILDIGTGTGLWSITMGDAYPGASITGNDLSPIQPDWVPTNVKFIVDDIELDWFQYNRYDYIHCRYMAASIKNWPRLVRQIYSALKPGGWVEFQEMSSSYYTIAGADEAVPLAKYHPAHPFLQLSEAMREACSKTGRMLDPTGHLRRWASDAGFVAVKQLTRKVPVGKWPLDQPSMEVGALMAVNYVEGVEAMTAVLLRDVLGWPSDEVEMLNVQVRMAAKLHEPKILKDYVVVIAQKGI
ncbi:hypothetical protein E4U14_000718 [Claviceps sp. LM454 group G7]|nr:hypothetical protein E4U14_000718 [Claviceps sp. LM454 group G7]